MSSTKKRKISIQNSSDCNKSPDLFCFSCALFIKSKSYPLSENNRQLYRDCYKSDATDNGADKPYASSKLCSNCIVSMRLHQNSGKRLKYSSPAKWLPADRESKPHEEVCYVCLIYTTRDSPFKPIIYHYPDSSNVTAAVLNATNEAVSANMNESSPSEASSNSDDSSADESWRPSNYTSRSTRNPIRYNSNALNNLIKKLDLSEEQAKVISSESSFFYSKKS